MKSLLTFLLLAFFWHQLSAQDFTNVTPDNMRPLTEGAFSAGDFNNDQNLDILNSGTIQALGLAKGASNVYTNLENFSFDLLLDLELDSVFYSAHIWGDFNNDGLLDIVISGFGNGPIYTNMYFNDGSGQFVLNDKTNFENLAYGDLATGDFDNDGDVDFINMGSAITGARKAIIYINNSDSTFTPSDDVLMGLGNGSIAVADYDIDGDLDILICGETGSIIDGIDQAFTLVYQNTDGQFQQSHELEPINGGEAKWIDYNVDGRPDIVLSGFNGVEYVSKLYLNDGTSFSGSDLTVDVVGQVSIAVGDINSDGYPDIVHSSYGSIAIHINDQSNGFSLLTGHNLSGSYEADIELADLDGDFDLDLMLSGSTPSSIYQNNIATSNELPTAPTNLQADDSNENSLSFTWDTATDAETPPSALRYNYFLVFDGDTLLYPYSHSNGVRKIQDSGNAQSESAIFNFRSPGSYTLGVQTIDQTLNASSFTTLDFKVNFPPIIESILYIEIDEDEPLPFEFSIVTIDDPDNVFPDDYTFSLTDGDNYTVQEETITPNQDYFGELDLTLRVFDGKDSSNVFPFTIPVIPINDPPVVTDFLFSGDIVAGEPRTFSNADFEILDVDNANSEITISLMEGDNFVLNGLELTPDETFIGDLPIVMIASDGVDTSLEFNFTVAVSEPLSVESTALFSVYPNPVDGLLNLNFTDYYVINKIELISLSGKVIPLAKSRTTIDLTNIKPGVYQLKIEAVNGDLFTEKIIIR